MLSDFLSRLMTVVVVDDLSVGDVLRALHAGAGIGGSLGVGAVLLEGLPHTVNLPRVEAFHCPVEYHAPAYELHNQVDSLTGTDEDETSDAEGDKRENPEEHRHGSEFRCAGQRHELVDGTEDEDKGQNHDDAFDETTGKKKYDDSYLLTSLEFAQELLEQPDNITQLELKLAEGADAAAVKKKLKEIGGDKFEVLDRLEQQGEMYRMMQIEKLMAYIFLSLILVIATFDVISTLSLLMVQKREDLHTIACLGGDGKMLRGIFLNAGRMICLIGGLIGTGLGALLCYIQQEYGIIRLGQSSGTFIIDYYPVSVHPADVILVLFTVVGLGFLSVRLALHKRSFLWSTDVF